MSLEHWKNIQSLVSYETMPWDIGRQDSNLEKALKFLKINKGKVLEIGCGVGNDALYLDKIGLDVDAIDINPHFINLAKEKTSNVNFICGDVFKDIPNTTYNLIYDRGFLHNIEYSSFTSVFRYLHSKLSSKGNYILITGHPDAKFIKNERPNPTPYYEIILGFRDLFNIKLIEEIELELNKDWNPNPLGVIYVLEKIDY